MAKIIVDGFEFFDWGINQKIMYFSKENLTEAIDYIKKNQIKAIAISDDLNDLSFFREITFIEDLHIGNNYNDYSGLYFIENLKKITINSLQSNSKIQIQKFKNLEYLSIDWYAKFPDLSNNLKLKELSIWKFRPKSKTFKEVLLPKNLEFLHITESNILNLDGLECPNLKTFEGHYCSKLESLSGIDGISNIETLVLDYCGKLTQYDNLKYCEQLRKIILGSCGNLPTLNWLKFLKNVKYFSFWDTKLEDGDVSPCFGIDYVSFKNAKHYNHKSEEFSNH